MNKEKLIKSNMKNVILDNWKSKLSYPLNYKDIEELENIIDYYEKENKKYKEVIDKAMKYIEKDYSYTKRHDIPLLTKDEQLAGKLLDILKEVE